VSHLCRVAGNTVCDPWHVGSRSTYVCCNLLYLYLCLMVYVQLRSEAEAELKTAQAGCARVLEILEARDTDL